MLGDDCVGKSTLLEMYFERIFTEVYFATDTIDCFEKTYRAESDDQEIHFKFWDTIGNVEFHSLMLPCLKAAQGIILMFDVTSTKSYDSVATWLDQIVNHAPSSIPVIIVGNKSDLVDERAVTQKDARARAKQLGISTYFEVSCKENRNVEECIEEIME